MKSRNGIKYKSQERLIARVLEFGISRKDVTGQLAKYFDRLYLSFGKTANNIRIYGDYVYIMNDETLITTYPVDKKLSSQIKGVFAKRKNRELSELPV